MQITSEADVFMVCTIIFVIKFQACGAALTRHVLAAAILQPLNLAGTRLEARHNALTWSRKVLEAATSSHVWRWGDEM
jgi:hypothetical protein